MTETLERIEFIDLVSDCIDNFIPILVVTDDLDREITLYLPEPQTKGTEYQKKSYSYLTATRVVDSFYNISELDDTTLSYKHYNCN